MPELWKHDPSEHQRPDISLHTLFNAVTDPLFLIEADGTIIDANTYFSSLTGFPAAGCIGMDAYGAGSSGLVIPEIASCLAEKAQEALRSYRELSFEEIREGTRYHHTIIPFPAPEGETRRLVVMVKKQASGVEKRCSDLAHHQMLIEGIPGSAFIVDACGKLLAWNSFARDIIMGLSDDAMPATDVLQPIHPDERELLRATLAGTFEHDIVEPIEIRSWHAARSSYQWRLVSGKRITIDSKPCLLIVGIDINKRKEAEQALAENRKRLANALEAARAGVWEWELATGESTWSHELWSLFGLREEERTPSFDLWAATIHPDDREKVMASISECTENGLEMNIEYRALHPDGHVSWLFSRGKPILGLQGEVVRYIGTIIDITQRKQVEEALKTNQARQDFILEKSHIGWWDLDLASFATNRTSEYDRIFGYDAPLPEWTYRTLLDHVLPEDRPRVERHLVDSLKNLESSEIEFRIRRPDGQVRWLWLTAGLHLDSSGTPVHLSGIVQDITERKKMLTLLTQSEARYRSLFDNMPKGVAYCRLIKDGDTAVDFLHLAVNPAFEKMTGFGDVTGKGLLELMPDIRNTDEEFFQIHCRVAKTGISEHFERYLKPIGQWVSTSVYSSEEDHFVAIIDIITEQKKSAQLISEGKAKLEAVLESMTDAVFFADSSGNFVDFNEAFAKFHKFDSKEACAIALRSYPEMIEVYTAEGEPVPSEQWGVLKAFGGQKLTNAEYILKRKDTGETWFGTYNFAPIRMAEGGMNGFVMTARDVTEMKRAELSIRESELKFRSIFDSAPLAISIETIRETRLVDVNESWLRLFGYRREEVLGRTATELGIMADVALHGHLSTDLEKHGKIVNRPLRLRTKGGEIIDAFCSAESVTIDGSPCMLVTTTDFTEQNRTAEAHEKLQAQLQQVQRMELVGQLAGGIAHDFNNALAAILGNTELLLSQLEDSHPFVTHLQSIRTSSERSAKMIHQLLAFARKQVTSPVIMELDDSIDNLQSMMRTMIDKDIRYEWRPAGDHAHIFIDLSQLDQIVTSLILNARDAISGNGSITVESGSVTVTREESENGHACTIPGIYATLSVTDTGSGIDEAVLPHIFEPYFTTRKTAKNSGLGLATVYGIVNQNHGFIECRTAPGQGTTFTIYLPVHATETETVNHATQSKPVGDHHRLILLVEDETEILKLIRIILARNGYRVLEAADAERALELAKRHLDQIELLLTDVVLPGLSGVELSRKLREERPDLKVLFMSGYALETIGFEELKDTGINFIQKPFTFKNFTTAVHQALELSNAFLNTPTPDNPA